MLRQLLRQILIFLTIKSLKKHGTGIVVITGNGQTSIAREAVYAVLKTKHAVRRNIEVPETEFSTPLTILGAKYYPQNMVEWIQTLIKAGVQLLLVKPHKHILVLEISDVKKEIVEFWLKTIQPVVLIICEKTTLDPEVSRGSHLRGVKPWTPREWVRTIDEKDKGLKSYFRAAREVGKQFGISEKEAEEGLKNFEIPQARIRVLRGKGDRVIIDSSYHYSPPPLKSVLELADQFEGKKLLITDYSRDKETGDKRYELLDLKDKSLILRLSTLNPNLIILRGRKKRTRKLLEVLTGRLQP